MANIDIVKEFQEIEARIAEDSARKKDITGLLRKKARLLKVCYNQISDALDAGVLDAVAPNYAKAISYLNNIKELQVRINDDFSETDEEIEKIHKLMRDNGMGWILENIPKKVED